MSAIALGLMLVCPVGTIDQVEAGNMAVLGATGVRIVSTRVVENRRDRGIHEGDRIELGPGGHCEVRPADLALRLRIEARLRLLTR